ncbi:ATP-binding cassette domain-containing protein, partial [Escherichia coli]
EEMRQGIVAAIERVGLLTMAKTPIEALSGGQFQRMLFARVMVQRAPLVMLDEPFTGIDEATCRELMALILEMHQQGQTILAVLHDNQRVADYFPETMLLTPQRARWGSTPDVLPAFHSARLA